MANQVAKCHVSFLANCPTLSTALKLFVAHCHASNLSPNTTAYYEARLKRFAEFVGNTELNNVSSVHVREFLSWERETNSQTIAAHSH
ncbi:MAG: phage integrase N-terminal SAM-like domain-containing protein, partial [Armatimonadota bacterium]|nr:phage integrase N-terminal SAM-like domain-containing protein [Armatimonadota bacterium]